MNPRAFLIGVLVSLTGCSPKTPSGPVGNGVGPFRGLRAIPRQLAFTCVTPECETILVVKVQSTVNRRVAVKRVVLSSPSNEYTLTPSIETPFILGASAEFGIDVKYSPQGAPGASDLKVLVTYTDASPDSEDPDRLEPNELEIPLIRRLVGEPDLEVAPHTLAFGLVRPGETKELSVTARNVGFGNIALAVDQADAGHPWVSVKLPERSALVPDAGVAIPVAFKPTSRGYYKGPVVLSSTTPAVGEVEFEVEGTSLIDGTIALEPTDRLVDFGEVPRRQRRTATARIANIGGNPLTLTSVAIIESTMSVRVSLPPNTVLPVTLAPLARLPITLELDGTTPGLIDGLLTISSSDPMRSQLEVPVRGTVTEPRIEVTPAMIAWGPTPIGWQVVRPVEIRNAGFGALTIRRLLFVGGTSTLFSFHNSPALPATLATGARMTVEVEFRADAMSAFSGSLSIESDDPTQQIVEVPLSGSGVSCMDACMVANAAPSCMNGRCSIAACNAGYYDTDGMASTGCECLETGSDASAFCSMGEYKGVLKDTSGGTAQHQGVVPVADDVDWIRFHAEDGNNVFSDDFDVRITLTSADPDIEMCVYRHRTTSHDTSCYMESESCGSRSYRRDGSLGSEDGADFDIKVFRRANAAPTCTTYTVSMSNG